MTINFNHYIFNKITKTTFSL